MQNAPIRFKFSMLPGDLIYSLPGIQHICNKYKTKAIIYLGLNIKWQMSDALKLGRENECTLTQKTLDQFLPLLKTQPYIEAVYSWEEECPEEFASWTYLFQSTKTQDDILRWYKSNLLNVVDLDKHQIIPVNVPMGNIMRWAFYTYPDLACDLSIPWLHVETNDTIPPDTILINRTARYRNDTISYSFLKQYEKRLLFVGTHGEWNQFRTGHKIELPRLVTDNFLELAIAIKSCSFFIGNQSLCFAMAEALKVPRILEISRDLPNVIPTGEKAYDFYFQSCLEEYVNELAK